ncbi:MULTISPECIES: hypothetical protein [Photorhabdus]|uniref:Uncharacterized protein n=2 Tax=Photorhabdus asymbiotica TaxID=291112 RepID=B6VL65_PHOAA|nr:hypothetical protein [Photorhabdus asymbiotica]RKS57140.1 hypothetical protein BDD30_3781 [Photorhabdus asymbiotica]CAQ84504.1 conserved hypothetical protein [Photorhabdus asymbiotica]CAR66895.1 Conserved Hypothetical Protein [Photorhabdus asymbiotica subsp. asymbiotica ATCC 43949]
MKKLLPTIALSLLAFNAYAAGSFRTNNPYPNLTPKQVTEKVNSMGARKFVISTLPNTDDSTWDYILSHISSGNSEWLKIVPILSTGVDAGSAEDLTIAVATAIPKNAAVVLSVLNDANVSISTGSVCSLPFYSGTEAELNQYIIESIRALYKSKKGANCLKTLVNTVGKSKTFQEH